MVEPTVLDFIKTVGSDLRDMSTALSKSEFAVTVAVVVFTTFVAYLLFRFIQHIFFLLKLSTMIIVVILSVGAAGSIWLRFSINMVPTVYNPPISSDPMLAPPAPPSEYVFIDQHDVEPQHLIAPATSLGAEQSEPRSSPQPRAAGPMPKKPPADPKPTKRHARKRSFSSNTSAKSAKKTATAAKPKGNASPSQAPAQSPSVLSRVATAYRTFHTVEHLIKPAYRLFSSFVPWHSDSNE